MKSDIKKLNKLGPEFSRNKFFEFCETEEGKRIFFLKKHLESISSDIIKSLKNGELKLVKKWDHFVLTIHNKNMDYKRQVRLEKEEIEYMKKNSRIKEILEKSI